MILSDNSKTNELPHNGASVCRRATGKWSRFARRAIPSLLLPVLWVRPASAVSITTVSQGQLPSGEIIQIVLITMNPGDIIPWHYHTGKHGWVTVVSGTLTEDLGCGVPMIIHLAGNSVAEPGGRVHRVLNLGQESVVFTGVAIFPACDPNQGIVWVNGPTCEGNSGKSRREPLPDCDD
jgi:quercetin dioxygenase-like cupin family protein